MLPGSPAVRSDNTSGHPGVYRKRDKWAARITYRKITYPLGGYQTIEEAIAVRQGAERALKEAPEAFTAAHRRSGKQETE